MCPISHEDEAKRFPHRGHKNVSLTALGDLADEAAVNEFYDGLAKLWASIHIAGGFAFAPIEKSDKALLMGQVETNLVSAYLCSPRGGQALRQGGRRPHRQCRGATRTGAAQGASMTAYAAAKAGVAALTVALGEEVAKDGILVNAVAPSIMDTPANRKSMPKADSSRLAEGRGSCGDDLFLASPENAVTRSAIVPVYGKS